VCSLRRAFENGDDLAAREEMAAASLSSVGRVKKSSGFFRFLEL